MVGEIKNRRRSPDGLKTCSDVCLKININAKIVLKEK
jgi:hypothetical protein